MLPTFTIARRTLRQLIRDKRFLALSLVVPLVIVYFLKLFFDAQGSEALTNRYALPIAAMIVHFLAFVLSAIALTTERTGGTLERVLIVGYRKRQLIYGYAVAYGGLGVIQSLIVLGAARYLLDLSYSGTTLLKVGGVMVLLALISVALGILVSASAKREAQVLPFIPLILLPSVFISGMLIDLDKLPEWAQWLSYILPLHYAVEFIMHVLSGVGGLEGNVAALVGILVALLLLAPFTIHERG